MKTVLLAAALAAAVHCASGQTTGVVMNVMLQQPMPRSFAEWQRSDRSLVIVTIVNYDPIAYNNVRLSAIVRDIDNGKIVARTIDNDPRMPRFNIPAKNTFGAPGTLILRGRDCINANAIVIDPGVRTQAITTNSLPEGNFEFCAKLLKEDNSELATTGNASECQSFGVVIPDPPVLVSPADSQGFELGTLPFFAWTPAAPLPPGTIAVYWVKIAPIFPGQSPQDAIDHNNVLLNKRLPITSYQYMPDDLLFSTFFSQTTTFAWQIRANDLEYDRPLTQNEGKSDVRTFHFDKPVKLTPPPPPPQPPAPPPPPPPPVDRDASGGRKPK